MQNLLFSVILAGGWFLTAFSALAETARSVDKAVEIPLVWQPDQHLYVKGTVGLSPERLGELESWLDVHAPHWTVVLIARAADEFWRGPDGTLHRGMDAVEESLGRRLPSETAFGNFTHPLTGERDGAWLVIFLEERKFSYWAADAYDRRRLGEDHWQGNLDSAAKQAMRGGGRIADAVQDTITSIDGELKRRLAHEAETRRQEADRQQRLLARTSTVLAETRQLVERSPGLAAALRADWPAASGLLAQPPVSGWQDRLTEAENLLKNGTVSRSASMVDAVRGEVESWETSWQAHKNAPPLFLTKQEEMDGLVLHPWSGAARAALLTARTQWREAVAAHAKGDPSFAELLAGSRHSLETARTSDAETRRLATWQEQLAAKAARASYPNSANATRLAGQSRKDLEAFPLARESGAGGEELLRNAERGLTNARLTWEAEMRRARDLRRAGLTGGAAGGAGLLLAGWAGHRRRRRIKERATGTFQQWEEALRNKTSELFALLDKAGRTVGDAALLERSGWSGTTRQLAAEAIRDVDQLFVMSSALDQVLEQARALIEPDNPLARGRNLVSGGRYQKALDLLEADQIQFGPESHIPAILSTAPDRPWRGLLGRREDCEPFTLTFSGLNEAFNERADRAVKALDRVGTAWTRISHALTELEQRMDDAIRLEKEVNTSAIDRRFAVGPVFSHLLPAARRDHQAAAQLGVSDPVQALEGPWEEGSRRTGDALSLCQAVLTLRSGLLPDLETSGTTLTSAGRQTAWIGTALDHLSSQADAMAQTAAGRSIKDDLTAWEAAGRTLRDRALQAVATVERASGTIRPDLDTLEALIGSERIRLGQSLGLSPDKLLSEPGQNPSGRLAAARECHAAALTELDRGDPTAAGKSLDEAAALTAEAHGLIAESAQAWAGHDARLARLNNETARLTALLPEHAALLETLCRDWAPAALHPAAADPEFPDPEESVADNLRRAEDLLASARQDTQAGVDACRHGALLASVESHERAAAGQAAAAAELQAIVQQRDAIQASRQANAMETERLNRNRAALQAMADEPVTMQPTRGAFLTYSGNLEAAIASAAATGRAADPFAARTALALAARNLTELEQALQADRQAFAEASRSLAHAARQLVASEPLLRQAAQDQIPDSTLTTDAQEALARLQTALNQATRHLRQPHGDWNALDQAADQIAAETTTWRARLQGELARAAASVEALNRAADRVRTAGGWSGALGVRITGVPGRDHLERARQAMDSGDYETAQRAAETALREAQTAIDAAEAEQRRRQREKEREAERQRRAAAERRSASSFSSGSSSSRGSSFGGSSSRSSSSRSSFSSGSGASRSGW